MRSLNHTLRRPLAALALLCSLAAVTYADVIRGRVVGIADGDTVTVLDASRSKQHLSDLVFNKEVSVEWEKRDRYGRVSN